MSTRSSVAIPSSRTTVVDPAYLSEIYASHGMPGGPSTSVPFPPAIPRDRLHLLTGELRTYTTYSSHRPSPLSQSTSTSPSSVRTQRTRYSAANPFVLPFGFDIRASQAPTRNSVVVEVTNDEVEPKTRESQSQSDLQDIDLESNITASDTVHGASSSSPALASLPEKGENAPLEPKFTWFTIPFYIYSLFLLCIPATYWRRADNVFRDADRELSRVLGDMDEQDFDLTQTEAFAKTWDYFISSIIEEYKNFNLISVFLMGVIIALLQIPSAGYHNSTRSFAMLSFICALFSLIFSNMYGSRFTSLKRLVEARTWLENIQRDKYHFQGFWNEWVLLSLPLVWLSWSIFFFLCAILYFVWRSSVEASAIATGIFYFDLITRVGVTVLVGLGVIYVVCILLMFMAGWERGEVGERSKAD